LVPVALAFAKEPVAAVAAGLVAGVVDF